MMATSASMAVARPAAWEALPAWGSPDRLDRGPGRLAGARILANAADIIGNPAGQQARRPVHAAGRHSLLYAALDFPLPPPSRDRVAIIEITDSQDLSGSDRPALDDLKLAIPRRVFGCSGRTARQSTLLSICPDCGPKSRTGAGAGHGVRAHRTRSRRFSAGAAGPGLYPALTARENLLFFGACTAPWAHLRERVEACLAIARLEELADRRAETSPGTQAPPQLVIGYPRARLLISTNHGRIDPQSRLFIHDTASLHAAGMTILYSTHYMEEAEQLCDDVAIIDRGRILARGTCRSCCAPPRRRHRGAPRGRPAGIRGGGGAPCAAARSRFERRFVLKSDAPDTTLRRC